MAYKFSDVSIRGTVPQIMHNGQLSNPRNRFAKAMKEITAKRNKKTDDDLEELMRIEFLGSLYVNKDGVPVWPGENIEAMIKAAAKARKRGKDVDKGIVVEGSYPLIYDGPKVPEELWKCEEFVSTVSVVIGKIRVMRTRAIFPVWALDFTVGWRPDVLNESDLKTWLEIAGRDIGLSDWRPKFGRFEVEAFSTRA